LSSLPRPDPLRAERSSRSSRTRGCAQRHLKERPGEATIAGTFFFVPGYIPAISQFRHTSRELQCPTLVPVPGRSDTDSAYVMTPHRSASAERLACAGLPHRAQPQSVSPPHRVHRLRVATPNSLPSATSPLAFFLTAVYTRH